MGAEPVLGRPMRFKTQPFAHQLECLNKHGRSRYFALLAEMGTGKTWIIINNVADLWASGDCDGLLVFAPNGVHENWTRLELPAHMPDWVRYRAAPWHATPKKAERKALEALFADAGNGELRILTMNWEALQTKKGFDMAVKFSNCFRRLMIVGDESDEVKNPTAARTKALMKLRRYTHWRRIMTGTLITEAPFDAFAQFGFLDENIFGTSFAAHKAEYSELLNENHHLIQHIVRKKVKMSADDQKAIAEDLMKLKHMIIANGRSELIEALAPALDAFEDRSWEKVVEAFAHLRTLFSPTPSAGKTRCLQLMANVDRRIAAHLREIQLAFNPKRIPQIVATDKEGKKKYRNLDKLARLIAPHSFRVLKKDCLDLPEKIYKTLFFDLTKEQQEVYRKAEEECRLVFEGETTPFNKLVAVTKLAQITSGYYIHPLADEPVRIEGANPKLDLLVERVAKIVEAGEKVIVWARYRVEIADVVARLEAAGHRCVQYHGDTKKEERTEAIEAFERGDAQVFVANQQAGGTGITLVAASYVIYYSNNFSLRDRLQSEDRAHRIGQTKNVTYINIAGKGTIDEAVIRALLAKKDVADAILTRGLGLFANAEQ